MLTGERDKRSKLSTKYNRGVDIIGVIDNCLGVTAIGLGIAGVGLQPNNRCSTIRKFE